MQSKETRKSVFNRPFIASSQFTTHHQSTSHTTNPSPTANTPTTNEPHHPLPTLPLTAPDLLLLLPPPDDVPALPLGLTAPLLVELALPEVTEVRLTDGRALTADHAVPVPEDESYPIQDTPALVESWTRADVEVAYVAEESFVVGPVRVFVVFVMTLTTYVAEPSSGMNANSVCTPVCWKKLAARPCVAGKLPYDCGVGCKNEK